MIEEHKPTADAKQLTRADLEAYRSRWQAAEPIEREEARQATPESRWDELNAIFEFADELGWIQPASDDDVAPIRERWAHLKAKCP
jgi:hypothetical protein